jgi:arylformamidase
MTESLRDEGWEGGLSPETPVWPGDRPPEFESRTADGVMVTTVSTTCHAGTHVDAPLHLSPTGIAVHEIPLGRLIGPAEVVRLPADCVVARSKDLPLGWIPRAAKILFRSDSHHLNDRVADGFTSLAAELVHWLADHGVSTIGIDTPSVDAFSSTELDAHRALIDRGMIWIEGLDLGGVEAGSYLLVALPVPFRGTEAAPVRALLRRRREGPT